MSPRRDRQRTSAPAKDARKPYTRASGAKRSGRESLSRRLSEGDLRSEQNPARRIPVGLSTSSVFPAGVEECFKLAERTGYDGVEVMVSYSHDSQDPEILRRYAERYGQQIMSLHAPTLFFLQRLWGGDAWIKIERTVQLALELGVPTVVAHPPFRWQGSYARDFVTGVAELEDRYGVAIAVENMYPWRLGVRELLTYLPDHDPTDEEYAHVTVDLSHAATAGDDALAMIDRLGDRLTHLHLADGSGKTTKDEHLPPGEGNQPCAEVLRRLANRGWQGSVLLEINTRGLGGPAERERVLRQSLLFARHHLGHHLDEPSPGGEAPDEPGPDAPAPEGPAPD